MNAFGLTFVAGAPRPLLVSSTRVGSMGTNRLPNLGGVVDGNVVVGGNVVVVVVVVVVVGSVVVGGGRSGNMLFMTQANALRVNVRFCDQLVSKAFAIESRSDVTTIGPELTLSAPFGITATVVPEMLLLTR